MDIIKKSFTDEDLYWLRVFGVPCSIYDHGEGVTSTIVVDVTSKIAYIDVPRHGLTIDQILKTKEKITEIVQNIINRYQSD